MEEYIRFHTNRKTQSTTFLPPGTPTLDHKHTLQRIGSGHECWTSNLFLLFLGNFCKKEMYIQMWHQIQWAQDKGHHKQENPAQGAWALSQYPKRRLSVRSHKVSKPLDLYLELSDRSESWQALRQQCCQCACQISKRYDNLKYQSRGFETLRDLTKRHLFKYWDGAQNSDRTNSDADSPWVKRPAGFYFPGTWWVESNCISITLLHTNGFQHRGTLFVQE